MACCALDACDHAFAVSDAYVELRLGILLMSQTWLLAFRAFLQLFFLVCGKACVLALGLHVWLLLVGRTLSTCGHASAFLYACIRPRLGVFSQVRSGC
jgi:hypothetical protein